MKKEYTITYTGHTTGAVNVSIMMLPNLTVTLIDGELMTKSREKTKNKRKGDKRQRSMKTTYVYNQVILHSHYYYNTMCVCVVHIIIFMYTSALVCAVMLLLRSVNMFVLYDTT